MLKYLLILLGLIIATLGFAFAFSSPNAYYAEILFQGRWSYLLSAFPNLFAGIVIGIGGIAIAATGKRYLPRHDTIQPSVCSHCGKQLREEDKFCPQCGVKRK